MAGKKQSHSVRQVFIMWFFLGLAIVSGFIGVQAYIGNSKESKKRYEALLAVDAAGGDVEKALRDLRSYIYAHMNTTIGSPTGVKPPIQLKGTYDRLVAAEKARIGQVNDNLYNKAQQVCEQLFPEGLSGRGRIPCITEYVTKNSVAEQQIPEGLYKYDFVAPMWSPDTAGIMILISVLSFIVFLFYLVFYVRLRAHLRRN